MKTFEFTLFFNSFLIHFNSLCQRIDTIDIILTIDLFLKKLKSKGKKACKVNAKNNDYFLISFLI